MTEFKQPF